MKHEFSKASQKSEAEQFLDYTGTPYEREPDGTIRVRGTIAIFNQDLEKLPDLSNVIVDGNFECDRNDLTSLVGSPQSVGGVFRCEENPRLNSLEGAPQDFEVLVSDFGDFESWENIPEDLRISPETITRLEKEAADAERQRSPALLRHLPAPKLLVPRK